MDELAAAIANLPQLPDLWSRGWRIRRRKAVRIVRVGPAGTLVVLKGYRGQKVDWYVHRSEYECLQLLKTHLGERSLLAAPRAICLLEDSCVLAMTHVPGKPLIVPVWLYAVCRRKKDKLIQWYATLGSGIAEYQRALLDVRSQGLHVHQLSAEQVRARTPGVPVLVKTGLSRIVDADAEVLSQSPCSLSHGDLSLHNVLLDRRENRLAVIDWEYAAWRSVFFDPINSAISLLMLHRRGAPMSLLVDMTKAMLDAWVRGWEQRLSGLDVAKLAQLELSRACCMDVHQRRPRRAWPMAVERLSAILSGLTA